jgi:hypothetical protein
LQTGTGERDWCGAGLKIPSAPTVGVPKSGSNEDDLSAATYQCVGQIASAAVRRVGIKNAQLDTPAEPRLGRRCNSST